MKFDKFSLAARPFITDAYCQCGGTLREVMDGLLSIAMFCPKCESVYKLKLVKVAKSRVNPKFIEQAKAEIKK